MLRLLKRLKHIWHLIRRVSGDDAYEQYLKHHAEFHAASVDSPAALTRTDFYKLWQDNQWKGTNRCC